MTHILDFWIADTRKSLAARTCLVPLIVALAASATAGGAFAQDASPALQTNAPAPARVVKVVCCRVSLQFLVDGRLVSHTDVMVFDRKERTVVVDSPTPGWNFHFSLTPSNDRQTLRWASSVDVAGRVVHAWAVTGAMKDPQMFTVTDASTHRKFSTVARAMVFVVPVLERGGARPARPTVF